MLYTSPPGRPVTLHFTPWQTCYFTLHPLADLLLYTSPPGRPVTLHFTPWQTYYFTLHPLADLLLYTSPPGRPVHSNTYSNSLESIQPCGNYCGKTTHSFVFTIAYCQVLIYTTEATWGGRDCPSLEMAARGFRPGFSGIRL